MAFLGRIKDGESKDSWVPERLDLELLAIGKRTGLSFAEINEFRVCDLLAYSKSYVGDGDSKEREATQKDIDVFYRN
ncbi:hypothetical protein [Desulfosporosinus sp.]|uniref:hypothetical protein n=1 Tax=Desulfosporosinus sp. TaxID=157907 RepID=UPI0025BE44DD|nr:hypothetical protein [Desulfosporosinus sp.]MBC2722342.1 hypothetical protein [Desulfosporosinus sp.]MBC2728624.1 hypothetical protein [Desulfosporosinus sp.]